MTMRLRDDLVATAKRMSDARPDARACRATSRAQPGRHARHAVAACRTPTWSPTTASRCRWTARSVPASTRRRPSGSSTATSSARARTSRRSSTRTRCSARRSRCCAATSRRSTTWSCSPAPTRSRAPSTRRSAAAKLALNAVVARCAAATRACWQTTAWSRSAATLAGALRLAAEVETLASQYWHAAQLGTPHVLDADELHQVRARFSEYGQGKPRPKRSW